MSIPDPNKIRVLKEDLLFQGFLRLKRYSVQIPLFNGAVSQPFDWEVLDRHDAVGVLPYDPVADSFVLIRQFRLISYLSQEDPWPFEIVAGLVDKPGQSLESVAQQEGQEEIGCSFKKLKHIYSYLPDIGAVKEKFHLYVGHLDSSKISETGGIEEHEDICSFIIPRKEALDMLHQGKINNAITLVSLQWFALHGDSLREEWLKE